MDNYVKGAASGGSSPAAAFKAQTDLSNLIPAVGAGVGIEDIGKAIEFYKKNRGTIATIIGFLKGIFGGGKKDAAPPVPQPSAPPPSAPPPSSTPGDVSVPYTPPASTVKVAGLRAKWFFIERKNDLSKQGGGRYILDKGLFDRIVSGQDYARLGDRLHVNITPYDQQGRDFQPGGAENKLLLNNPGGEQDTPNFRIKHEIRGNGELTSEYDDYGCTPVILVPWETGKVDSDEESSVTYVAKFYAADGNVLTSDPLPAIRVKA